MSKGYGIKLMLTQQLGKPNQNTFVKRSNRCFSNKVLDANLFRSIAEAHGATTDK